MRRPRFPTLAACSTLLLMAAPLAHAHEPVVAAAEAPAPAALDATWREQASPAASTHTPKRWSTSAEVESGAYRVSLSRGKLDMGVGFDAPSHPLAATSTAARSTDPTRPIVPTVPSLSVGMVSTSAGPTPSSLIERATDTAAPPASTRRVGLEWKPAQSRLFVRGGLGLRLSGDDQVTMKLRSGRIGIYMKSTF